MNKRHLLFGLAIAALLPPLLFIGHATSAPPASRSARGSAGDSR